MLYEAEKIIAVLKECIFEKENNLESINEWRIYKYLE
jgi:hypothetical protein